MIKELKDYFAPLVILIDLALVPVVCGVSAWLTGDGFLIADIFSETAGVDQIVVLARHEGRYFYFPILFLPPIALLLLDRIKTRISAPPLPGICFRSGAAVMAATGLYFLLVQLHPSLMDRRNFIGICLFLFLIFSVASRAALLHFVKYQSNRSNFLKNVLLLGTDEKALALARKIDMYPEWGLRVDGYLSDNSRELGHKIGNHPVIGSVESLAGTLKKTVIDCILYAGDIPFLPYVDSIFQRCRIEGIDFAYMSTGNETPNPCAFTDKLGRHTIVILKTVFQSPSKLFIKRLFDFFASTTLICLTLPFWITIPLLIKSDSPGPVFFRQERVGKNGRRFTMYKFRSMVNHAEKFQMDLGHLNEMDGPAFKIKNDPRQTRIGRLLRQTSLDELPQLFNVFKGDISLVGPRPPVWNEVAQYHPWEKKRLSIMPGITCLWQVSGRNNIKFDEWMKLDLMYIENWSFALDLKILVQTIPAVFSKRGAH